MPADFPERAKASLAELADVYHISKSTAREWRRKLGISVPRGAPTGNRNAIPRKQCADDSPAIRTCLNCTKKVCRGHCEKVH